MNIPEMALEKLEQLAKQYNNPDLLLLGDGSGTVFRNPCGFACVSYDVDKHTCEVHFGGLSHGTNNFAELMPYVHALAYDHLYRQKSEQGSNILASTCKVEVISDSELTVKQGNQEYVRHANRVLWASVKELEGFGYTIHWNHILRATNEFNSLCDSLAGQLRKKITEFVLTS
jgi:ribonuclease HI